jgi:hypothetical protein
MGGGLLTRRSPKTQGDREVTWRCERPGADHHVAGAQFRLGRARFICQTASPISPEQFFLVLPSLPHTLTCKEEKEAERREAHCLQPPHLAVRRCPHPDPPPQAGEGMGGGSSPVGVPPRFSPGRQLVPKAQRQAMLSETVRSARSYGPPTGAKIVRVSTGVTRAGRPNKSLSPSSEHLTRRS